MEPDALERAQGGDQAAFEQLVAPYRRELQALCYRMLGSMHDAEDVMQEVLLAIWRGLPRFEGRSSVRTWLYRIATNRCLNARRSMKGEPQAGPPGIEPPAPTRLSKVFWLEPCSDELMQVADREELEPGARYERTEALSLAFVTALQSLPPRQRAVFVLRDVLGFPIGDITTMLGANDESVSSALKRARATMRRELPKRWDAPPPPHSEEECRLVRRFTEAFESGHIDQVLELFTEDVWFRMPPLPFEYQGSDACGRFLEAVVFSQRNLPRLIPSRANGQAAFGMYLLDEVENVFHASGFLVLSLAGSRICVLTHFGAPILERFGLPRSISAECLPGA